MKEYRIKSNVKSGRFYVGPSMAAALPHLKHPKSDIIAFAKFSLQQRDDSNQGDDSTWTTIPTPEDALA